ncbi:MAG: glucose 1-dehydrogenase [Sphingomonas sp.]|uniref:SDR family NAD(P)-dependent oxidoreductase n=1 Tax=Sphingomonas sp. TaxID=28214 RepID=UPI0022754294|nr:glucose 1-dehydrogenase [Sphingomonas sp.]MCX8474640.1 glucose 1-dehydrogenase [Sphingomonas sp.]
MTRFAGRCAVVTGAASGIGLETARRFAAEGARVALVDRDGDAVSRACAELAGDGHHAIVMDVTDEAGWAGLAETIDKSWGQLDILVNNAGTAPFRAIVDTTLDQWRDTIGVNLDSTFLGTRAMLPLLARSGRGAIVNVSSIRGIIGGVDISAYCAAKGGVRMFTKATALECAALGNGVRANSVHPGLIATPLAAAALADPEAAARRMAALPLGRAGEPGDVAAAILFAASDEAAYMTGAELVIDGGTIAQ